MTATVPSRSADTSASRCPSWRSASWTRSASSCRRQNVTRSPAFTRTRARATGESSGRPVTRTSVRATLSSPPAATAPAALSTGRRAPADALADAVGVPSPVLALGLRRQLAAEAEAVLAEDEPRLGIVEPDRVDELQRGRQVLAEREARARVGVARDQRGLDVHLVEPEVAEAAGDVPREAPGEQGRRLPTRRPGGAARGVERTAAAGRHEARDLALRVRGVGGQVEARTQQRSARDHGDLDVLLADLRDQRLGRDRHVGVERAVVDEAAVLDRELAVLQEDLAALAHRQAPEGRRIERVAAHAQAAARLQLRQVVAHEHRPVGDDREVERDPLQEARLARPRERAPATAARPPGRCPCRTGRARRGPRPRAAASRRCPSPSGPPSAGCGSRAGSAARPRAP